MPLTTPLTTPTTTQKRITRQRPRRSRTTDLDLRTPSGRKLPF